MIGNGTANFIKSDLAPGEKRSAELDTSPLDAHRVKTPGDPLFGAAYDILWNEFGAAAEVESRAVLARRLSDSASPRRYELMTIRRDDKIVAVRDHQAIADEAGVVVHLSHAWIRPDFRRTGLAGWLRALPVQLARDMVRSSNLGGDAAITLLAEMEHPVASLPQRMIRLAAYEKAGFAKIDPAAFDYRQPDFRPPAEIDAFGGPKPLPFALLARRVGRESELSLNGGELHRLVAALYRLYGFDFRTQDMAALWQHLAAKRPADEAVVRLVPPTQAGRA